MKINEFSVVEAARRQTRPRQASLNLKLLWKVMGMMYRARPVSPKKVEGFAEVSWGGRACKYWGALCRSVMLRFPA